MENVLCISVFQAQEYLTSGATLVDIRDAQSFMAGRAEGAFHLTDSTLNRFIVQVDFATPLLVMCYHGNSSKGAAQYLINQGFEQVYSIDGGFSAWRMAFPQLIASGGINEI